MPLWSDIRYYNAPRNVDSLGGPATDNWSSDGRLAGAQQAKPAIDRESLEQALKFFHDRNEGPNTAIVLEAARAHLKTLPKTKVEFRVWWECQGADFSAPFASRPEAEKFHDHVRSPISSARFVHITGPHTVYP